MVNLTQKASHMPRINHHVPALLTKSVIWAMGKSREALLSEHAEIMGYVLYSPDPDDDAEEPDPASKFKIQTPLRVALLSTHDGPLRQMLGNGMHLSSVGSSLAFMLCIMDTIKPS